MDMYQNIIFDLVGVVADFGTKRIFEHFMQTAKIKAEETAFFDDSPANVEVAIRLGIHAEVMKTQFTLPLAPSWPWLLS